MPQGVNQPLLKPLLALGEALLAAGAEPYRAKEAVERAAAGFGCDVVDAFVTPPGLFISVEREDVIETGVRCVRRRSLDIARLATLNSLARAAAQGTVTADECLEAIGHLQTRSTDYGMWTELFAGAVASGSYSWFVGATPLEASLAAVGGAFTVLLRRRRATHFAERYFNFAAGGFVVALLGVAAAALWHVRSSVVTAGGVIVLVPGLALTGVLRDLLHGDMLSAGTSALDALTIAAALASGAAVGVGVALSIGWGR